MYIVKRDGTKQLFDHMKIVDAILKAFKSVDGDVTDYALIKAGNIADYIAEQAEQSDHDFTIDEIQSLVEHGLMSTKRKDVATAYIEYRHDRDQTRKWNGQMMQLFKEKMSGKQIDNQNANVDERSFGGRKGEAESVILKEFALDNCMSEKASRRHRNNEVYIHDLDSYAAGMHNCLTIPFDDLLANGFDTRQTDIRIANSVGTAFQLVAVIFQLQSLQQFGGVSASHLDWTMVPYVRKSLFKHYILEYLKETDEFMVLDILNMSDEDIDQWCDNHKEEYLNKFNLTEKDFFIGSDKLNEALYKKALFETKRELKQAVEGMYHNLNTLQSRSGNQLPFTSINYGTCTLPEGRMVIEALLNGSIKGIGKRHRTPIFPCGIFQCMKYVNRKPGDKNYDLFRLALKSTAKRLYPNYANCDWSGNAGYDPKDPRTYFSTMGCRTANGWDINGFGQLKDGRGNICPVTVIMPTIAMKTVNSEPEWEDDTVIDQFMRRLDEAIVDAKDMLLERFEYICSQSAESAKFMYENGTMAGYIKEEGIRSALKHGTLAIGQLGMAETLQILVGCDHTESKGMKLAKRIEQLFKDRCAQFKKEYSLNFGVYMTPAENLCYTAMKKFKEAYGEIPNVSDRDYFTNSIHVPVWKEISPFEKIDIEAELTGYSSAGCITYVELEGSVLDNIDALETLVNYAMDKDIPYFAINVPSDLCLDCGYTGLINDECPMCKSKNVQHLRRVTGYLTGDYKTSFNYGKQKETEDRFKHSKLWSLPYERKV